MAGEIVHQLRHRKLRPRAAAAPPPAHSSPRPTPSRRERHPEDVTRLERRRPKPAIMGHLHRPLPAYGHARRKHLLPNPFSTIRHKKARVPQRPPAITRRPGHRRTPAAAPEPIKVFQRRKTKSGPPPFMGHDKRRRTPLLDGTVRIGKRKRRTLKGPPIGLRVPRRSHETTFAPQFLEITRRRSLKAARRQPPTVGKTRHRKLPNTGLVGGILPPRRHRHGLTPRLPAFPGRSKHRQGALRERDSFKTFKRKAAKVCRGPVFTGRHRGHRALLERDSFKAVKRRALHLNRGPMFLAHREYRRGSPLVERSPFLPLKRRESRVHLAAVVSRCHRRRVPLLALVAVPRVLKRHVAKPLPPAFLSRPRRYVRLPAARVGGLMVHRGKKSRRYARPPLRGKVRHGRPILGAYAVAAPFKAPAGQVYVAGAVQGSIVEG